MGDEEKSLGDKKVILRVATVAHTFDLLLKGQLNFLKNSGFVVYMACRPDQRARVTAEREGAIFIPINLKRTISPLNDLVSIIVLWNVIRRVKPDIVHSHSPKAGLVAMIAAALAFVPIRLHTVAGAPWEEGKGIGRVLMILSDWVISKLSHKVIFNSSEQRDRYIMLGLTKCDKAVIIGKGSSNGIDLAKFVPAIDISQARENLFRRFRVDRDSILLLFVGRQSKSKGLVELYHALVGLHHQYPSLRLLVVGEEEERDPIDSEMLNRIRRHPAICMAGFVSDVETVMQASDIFIFPSHREGLPQVVLQAAATELPIVLSDISGCRELLSHRRSGIFVPAKDISALTDAVCELLSNRDYAKKLGRHARLDITEKYDRNDFWESLRSFYFSQINLICR